jgi:hypothetical protein
LPKDLQALIAKMDAGGLLSLAQANRMFADIARNDQVWKDLFQRDFPHDWKYCQGELPFFVITEDHPLWQPGFINENDKSGWKRFYLHTRELYGYFIPVPYDSSLSFNDRYTEYQKGKHEQIVINHCSYLFVCLMAYLFKGRGAFDFRILTPTIICSEFITNSLVGGTLDWLKNYVRGSFAFFNNQKNYFYKYTRSRENITYFFNNQNDKKELFKLFNEEDKESFVAFLNARAERSGIFKGFDGLEGEELDIFKSKLFNIWNMITLAYHNRKSIYAHPMLSDVSYFGNIIWHMVGNSYYIKNNVNTIITNNPHLTFDLNYGTGALFDLPRFESLFNSQIDPYNDFSENRKLYKRLFKHFASAPRVPLINNGSILKFIACDNCNLTEASQKCGRCGKAFYCSKGCQKAHWHSGEHKC